MKQNEVDFQIELLKIQSESDWRMNCFFSILGIIVTLIFIFPIQIYFLAPILIGFILIFIYIQQQWKKEKIFKLKRNYAELRTHTKEF